MDPAAFVCVDEAAAWGTTDEEAEEDAGEDTEEDAPEADAVTVEVLVTVTTGTEDCPAGDAGLGDPPEDVVVGDEDEGVVGVTAGGDVAVVVVPDEAPFVIVN